jgi:predicted transcriptional regulator
MEEKYLKKMVDLLEQMNNRLKSIESKLSIETVPMSSLDLLTKIPKSHLQTYFTVQSLEEATCSEIAEVTGRSHNLESRYLRRLKDIGVLQSKRVPVSNTGDNWKGTEVRYFLGESD